MCTVFLLRTPTIRGRVPDDRRKDMTVRTSTTVGPTTGVADEGNLPDRIAVLIGVIVALVGPETETRRRVAAMMTETVLTDTDVEDRIGDRVAPDAEMIQRQTGW